MEPISLLTLILGLVILLLLSALVPRREPPTVIYIPVQPIEPQRTGLGCFPVVFAGALILILLGLLT